MCTLQHTTTFIPPFTKPPEKKKNWWFSWWCWFRGMVSKIPKFRSVVLSVEKLQHFTCFFFFRELVQPPATKFRIISLKISRSFTLNHCGIASVTSNAIPGACFQADFAFTVVGHLDRWNGAGLESLRWLWVGLGWRWSDFFYTPPPKKKTCVFWLEVGSNFFWW